MARNVLRPLALYQLLTPPFRVETGLPPSLLPIYGAETPEAPPSLPYRKLSNLPSYPSYKQIQQTVLPQNLLFNQRRKT
jgi:hypothetical protein